MNFKSLLSGELGDEEESPVNLLSSIDPRSSQEQVYDYSFFESSKKSEKQFPECYSKNSPVNKINDDECTNAFEIFTKQSNAENFLDTITLSKSHRSGVSRTTRKCLDSTSLVDQISVVSLYSEEQSECSIADADSDLTLKGSEQDSEVQPTETFSQADLSLKIPAEAEPQIQVITESVENTDKHVQHTKHRKVITLCPHIDQEYYAKGMCRNCYHNRGKRTKKASKCLHTDRDHYAKGLCKNCYLHFFHIKKKARKAK